MTGRKSRGVERQVQIRTLIDGKERKRIVNRIGKAEWRWLRQVGVGESRRSEEISRGDERDGAAGRVGSYPAGRCRRRVGAFSPEESRTSAGGKRTGVNDGEKE